jgi:hypothetical protein
MASGRGVSAAEALTGVPDSSNRASVALLKSDIGRSRMMGFVIARSAATKQSIL